MRKIIIDTDIGIDCDDAAALAILFKNHLDKKCKIIGVSASTAREGSSGAIRGFLDYYGLYEIPCAKMNHSPLKCDEKNVYAGALRDRFKTNEAKEDAVSMMRRLLSESYEKVTLCSIGPLSNIADLLSSDADEYSKLNGYDLVKDKVSDYYIMGGSFYGNMNHNNENETLMTEWNIEQDIDSARFVSEKCPVPMYYCPYEIGIRVKTYIPNDKSPVYQAMSLVSKENGEKEENFTRASWDPITCMWAMGTFEDMFKLSEKGIIRINEKGQTIFEKNEKGNHYYMMVKGSNLEKTEKILNDFLK